MACCRRDNKIKIPKEQQNLINKIKTNTGSNQVTGNSSIKSNRSRPGTIAKSCPKCSTKTIGTVCPVCSTIIP